MQVEVTITNIATVNTDVEGIRENQPLVEFTLHLKRAESEEIGAQDIESEIKFTEMLSVIADMTPEQLGDHILMLVQDYVNTALKGQKVLTAQKEWAAKDTFLGKTYTIEV